MADNVVEILVRSRDKTKAGFTDAVASSETAADRMQAIWSKHADAINTKLGNIGSGLAKGGGLLSIGSAALAAAAPLGALTVAVAAFGAVAYPELKKGSQGAKELSSGFAGLQKAMAPLVDKVIALGVHLLKDLLPSLTPLAKAGASVITAFIKPLDAFVRSKSFDAIIASFAQFAVQAAKLAGPVLTQLIKLLLQLFVQLMPSGMQILKLLLPLIVQLVTDLTPVIVTLAKVTAAVLNWMNAHKLLKPVLLGLIPVIMLLIGSTGIGAILIAISLLAAGIVEFKNNWSKIWATVKNITSEAAKFLEGIFRALPAPLQNALKLIASVWKTQWDFVRGYAKTIWDAISGLFRVFTDLLKGNWGKALSDIKATASRVWNDIRSLLSGLWSNLGRVFGNLLNLLKSEASAAWNSIRSTASSVWNSIWNNTVSRVSRGVSDVIGWIKTIPGKIVSAVGNAGSVLVGWGKGVIQGLLNGFGSIWSSVVNFFTSLPKKILGWLGIKSPPQWAIDAGKHIMNGLGIGLSMAQGVVSKATAKQIALSAQNALGGGGGGGPVGGDAAANKRLARQMFPWPASMWPSFDYLEMREAGYNRFARNPSSGAYGIPQALPPTKMPFAAQAAGGSHAGPQLSWMFSYIRSVYGNPVNAAAHERSHNWYASGGVTSAGWAVVGEHGRELMKLPGGAMVRSASDAQQMLGAGGIAAVQLEIAGGGQSQVEQFLLWMIRNLVRVKGGGDVQKAFGRT